MRANFSAIVGAFWALSSSIAHAQSDGVGSWSPVISWAGSNVRAFSIHLALLPDKRLIMWNWSRANAVAPFQPTATFRTWTVGGYPDYTQTPVALPYWWPGGIDPDLTVPDDPYHALHENELFCAGHTLTWDGKFFTAGGHKANNVGVPRCNIFDPFQNSWFAQADMTPYPGSGGNGRWYPTCLQLGNRQILILSGTRSEVPMLVNDVPEIWAPGIADDHDVTVRMNSNGLEQLDLYYPHAFIDPTDGNVIVMGNEVSSASNSHRNRKLDLSTLVWSTWNDIYAQVVPAPPANVRINYPSAVMMDGKIIRSGGSKNGAEGAVNDSAPSHRATEATNNAIYLDIFGDQKWRSAGGGMVLARKNHTLVALPDGKVLAMGGCFRRNNPLGNEREDDDPNCEDVIGGKARATPEIWDPENPTQPWHLLAAPPVPIGRPYHSCSLLLPDARVFFSGGEMESRLATEKRTAQIFSPPYGGLNDWALHRPSKPRLIGTLGETNVLRYGEPKTIRLSHPEGRRINRITLVALGSTTHSFNMNQTYVTLHKPSQGFLPLGKTLQINPPATTAVAQPGFYMLFAVDELGVPSEAEIVQLKDFDPFVTTPEGASIVLNRGTATDPAKMTWDKLRVAENEYFGGQLNSDDLKPKTIELDLQLKGLKSKASKIRVMVEAKSDVPSKLEVFLKNKLTGAFERVLLGDAGLIGPTERCLEMVTPASTSFSDTYIETSSSRLITVRLRWTADSRFAIKLDKVEAAVR